MHTLLHWLVSACSLLITAYLVRGFKIRGFGSALVAAAVIGAANLVVWPILIVLTLPLNILTLGLFTFVVNGAVEDVRGAPVGVPDRDLGRGDRRRDRPLPHRHDPPLPARLKTKKPRPRRSVA